MADKSVFWGRCLFEQTTFVLWSKLSYLVHKNEIFIQSLDKNIWNAISNNTYVHMPEINESSKEHLDCMAQHIIVSALDSDVLLKVSECTTTKGMWDRLEEFCLLFPRSDLVDKEESFAGSSSSENEVEVCLMTKGESE